MTVGHRDGENSPQERPRASEEEKKVFANGTPSTEEGGDFISQTEVETDHEPSQLADRHFGMVIFRQQQGTTAESTDWGGDYSIRAHFAGNTNTGTRARVAAREEAAIGRHQRGAASTDQNKQYDRDRKTADLLISAGWPCCILYALLCVCFFFFFFLFYLPCNFPCYHTRY